MRIIQKYNICLYILYLYNNATLLLGGVVMYTKVVDFSKLGNVSSQ